MIAECNSTANITARTLYIVPTPIGNLKDITLRSVEVLSHVDIIACEDTRHSGILLKTLEIHNKGRLCSYFEHNEEQRATELIEELINGKSVALISDAGTPCISDPGYRLINKAHDNNVRIVSLPGATAFAPALVASGFPCHSFIFMGFPPHKKGRSSFIKKAVECDNTVILYESSHRIKKLISEIVEMDSNVNISVSREISKLYEEHISFSGAQFLSGSISIVEKGEFVIILSKKRI